MILCDSDIKAAHDIGDISIDPEPNWIEQLQPASLDVTLGNTFAEFAPHAANTVIELGDDVSSIMRHWKSDNVLLKPGCFILATTEQRVTLSKNIVARVEGRSSFGRLGIIVHATAGFIDPGFEGQITLEMSNIGKHPVRIKQGTRVAQLCFEKLLNPCATPYAGKYQDQRDATASRIHLDRV